ncbi:MAG: GAF domain-containing protein [Actinobacteria bacterium]|nr:MAG: GAF domain-containing protein [Actinomycetota bacterium]
MSPSPGPGSEAVGPASARVQVTLADLGHDALVGADLPRLMDEAVAVIAQTLGVRHVSVLELDRAGETLRLRAGIGWREGTLGSMIDAMPGGYAAFTLSASEPVVVGDLSTETRFAPSPELLEHGVVASVAVRIMGAGLRPYGVLGAHSVHPREFDGSEVEFLCAVANLVALGIHRRRQALELNDTILQEAVVAKYALEAGQVERAQQVLLDIVARAQAMINDLLGGASGEPVRGLVAGDLRRAPLGDEGAPTPADGDR